MNSDSIIADRRAKFKKAADLGRGNLYIYGLNVIKLDQKEFYEKKKHLAKPCMQGYEPNPYVYQYDLEVHLFLNYDQLIEREIELIEKRLLSHPEEAEQLNIKLDFVKTRGTGLPRSEHFWNAVSLRWPVKTDPKTGKETGYFIREPWGEDFIDAICEAEYVDTFGGSGQGKTHRALAFMCVVWDHYIDSEQGGRCRFSTVAEDKIKDSTWPYLQRIYKHSKQGISLYCGRGIEFGEYTIARPYDKKGGGSIKGILIPVGAGARAVDKITGSHGHPVAVYHIDEKQSTPPAPIQASTNFLQNAGRGWITASGNYDKDEDSLGRDVTPENGWDSVDENTHTYWGINSLGIRCRCIHYNNDLSPAYSGEGKKKWGHILPTEDKKKARYPTEVSRRTDAYRRLWIGWRVTNADSGTIVNKTTLKEMGCMQKQPNWRGDFPVTHYWAFDSAPTSLDRNILLHFADGVDGNTNRWKIHFYEAIGLPKVENVTEYLELTSTKMLEYSKQWGVLSGNAILDWTNITGLVEKLKEKGFQTQWMVYNQAPPDGKRKDARTGDVKKAVLIDDITGKYAHTEVANMISMGALLLQNFILHGQVTGLHEEFINANNSDRTFDEEICLRKFITMPSKAHGDLLALEPKGKKTNSPGFIKIHGFSPDILDCLFEAAAFMCMYRGMVPGYLKGNSSSYVDQNEDYASEYFKKILAIAESSEIFIDDGGIDLDEALIGQYASSFEDDLLDML